MYNVGLDSEGNAYRKDFFHCVTVDFNLGTDSAATSGEGTMGGIVSRNLISPLYITYEGANEKGISVFKNSSFAYILTKILT